MVLFKKFTIQIQTTILLRLPLIRDTHLVSSTHEMLDKSFNKASPKGQKKKKHHEINRIKPVFKRAIECFVRALQSTWYPHVLESPRKFRHQIECHKRSASFIQQIHSQSSLLLVPSFSLFHFWKCHHFLLVLQCSAVMNLLINKIYCVALTPTTEDFLQLMVSGRLEWRTCCLVRNPGAPQSRDMKISLCSTDLGIGFQHKGLAEGISTRDNEKRKWRCPARHVKHQGHLQGHCK
jgi:hypothetical protein